MAESSNLRESFTLCDAKNRRMYRIKLEARCENACTRFGRQLVVPFEVYRRQVQGTARTPEYVLSTSLDLVFAISQIMKTMPIKLLQRKPKKAIGKQVCRNSGGYRLDRL